MTRFEKPIWAVKLQTPPAYNVQGVFFMCRYHQLWGGLLLAFGLGVLIGMWIEGGFVAHCFGFGLIFIGFGVAWKK